MKTLAKCEKLGRLIKPNKNIAWMSTFTGPSFALRKEGPIFDIYVTGRDEKNRSTIGKMKINMDDPLNVLEISPEPVFTFGELGAFDENGVSYPYLVQHDGKTYMYYVGWMPSVLTPFQNHLGLAVENTDGTFTRVSKAPIMERNDDDHLCIGSACVFIEDSVWKMWYTSFLKWGKDKEEHKHHYVIKYAESDNGINWKRNNNICINFKDKSEYAIGKPCVLKIKDAYHMWYSYRGKEYRIGYAVSNDGLHWERQDELAGIDVSDSGWDSQAVCYSHVVPYKKNLYMLYNGNHYGKEGLGIARIILP